MSKKRINSLRKKHEFRQFERRIWKEVELARQRDTRFEAHIDAVKSAASGYGSSPSVPSSANS
jgi:hypothetical protein